MDVVAIEKDSFDSFRKNLEQIVSLVGEQTSFPENSPIEREWVEGGELAASLNLSLRSLQYLRERGILSFSTAGKKVYYRTAEIQALLEEGRFKANIKKK